MKAYILLLCCISLALHSQQHPQALSKKNNDSFFKELRMQFHEDPKAKTIITVFGSILVACGYFRPMAALSAATVAGVASFLAYWEDRDLAIQKRKEGKDLIAYGAFVNGPQTLIEQVCQADEYQQTDVPSLQKQNTIFLIEVLKRYDKNPKQGQYKFALDTLKKNHADLNYAYDHFKKTDENIDALKWLTHNGLHLKLEQNVN